MRYVHWLKKGIEPVIMANVDTTKPARAQIIEHVQDGRDYIVRQKMTIAIYL
jgi:hypothetical protein